MREKCQKIALSKSHFSKVFWSEDRTESSDLRFRIQYQNSRKNYGDIIFFCFSSFVICSFLKKVSEQLPGFGNYQETLQETIKRSVETSRKPSRKRLNDVQETLWKRPGNSQETFGPFDRRRRMPQETFWKRLGNAQETLRKRCGNGQETVKKRSRKRLNNVSGNVLGTFFQETI